MWGWAGGGYTFPLVMRVRLVEELKCVLWKHEISIEIKTEGGGVEFIDGRRRKNPPDRESTQLNALIIVPLHFLKS